jgi:hypothetical protein
MLFNEPLIAPGRTGIKGLTLFTGDGPSSIRRLFQDGLKDHFQDIPSQYWKSQRGINDAAVKVQVIAKLMKVCGWGCILA